VRARRARACPSSEPPWWQSLQRLEQRKQRHQL
jgi:hypothetical protein